MDTIRSGPGGDGIYAEDNFVDRINSGTGFDGVFADASDRVSSNCEDVR